MIAEKLKEKGWMLVAVALAALLLVQSLRLENADKATAQAVATLNSEREAHERQARTLSERYRTLEGNHREEIDRIETAARDALEAAASDAGRARAAAAGLQRDIADYITAHRRAAQSRAAAGQCAPSGAAIDMLADLQRRADARAGELAAIADDARARGAACERAYDAARAMNEPARDAQAQ